MTRTARVLEIGPFPPPGNGWAVRIAFVLKDIRRRGSQCIALNIGEQRRVPSSEYECVRNGPEYMWKLLRYGARGWLFHLHVNGHSHKGLVVTWIAAGVSLLTGRRPVLTFHGGAMQTYFPRERAGRWLWAYRGLFQVCRFIICNNDQIARAIADYGVDRSKIVPILPFSRQYVDSTSGSLNSSLSRFHEAHESIVVVYLELRPDYGVESLFDALQKIVERRPRVGVVAVGASSNHDRRQIQQLAQSRGITENFLHVGGLEHAEFLSLLARSNVYLRSPRSEGSSSSIREAISLGIPVVASQFGDLPASVVRYQWGDAPSMAEAVSATLTAGRLIETVDPASIPDTVADEAQLLIETAVGRAPAASDGATNPTMFTERSR